VSAVETKEANLKLFCFASKNLENILRGYSAKRWAVSKKDPSRIGKAKKNLKIGERGLIYCSPAQSFTMPFIVKSEIDTEEVVTEIWPEPWVLPFDIEPLGNPAMMLPAKSAFALWPCLQGRENQQGGITAAFNATGVTVFSPNHISEEDWNLILRDLAE